MIFAPEVMQVEPREDIERHQWITRNAQVIEGRVHKTHRDAVVAAIQHEIDRHNETNAHQEQVA